MLWVGKQQDSAAADAQASRDGSLWQEGQKFYVVGAKCRTLELPRYKLRSSAYLTLDCGFHLRLLIGTPGACVLRSITQRSVPRRVARPAKGVVAQVGYKLVQFI